MLSEAYSKAFWYKTGSATVVAWFLLVIDTARSSWTRKKEKKKLFTFCILHENSRCPVTFITQCSWVDTKYFRFLKIHLNNILNFSMDVRYTLCKASLVRNLKDYNDFFNFYCCCKARCGWTPKNFKHFIGYRSLDNISWDDILNPCRICRIIILVYSVIRTCIYLLY